jgi:hypothetical protein
MVNAKSLFSVGNSNAKQQAPLFEIQSQTIQIVQKTVIDLQVGL